MCVNAQPKYPRTLLTAAAVGAIFLCTSVQLGMGIRRHAARGLSGSAGYVEGGRVASRLPFVCALAERASEPRRVAVATARP